MKTLKQISVIALTFTLLLGWGFLPKASNILSYNVKADDSYEPTEEAKQVEDAVEKADSPYTYTVTVYSGESGYFGSPGNTVLTFQNLKYGQEFTVDVNSYGLVCKEEIKNMDGEVVLGKDGNPKKRYYARGATIAGHDNDEVGSRTYQSYSFTVTQDESFTVAYGQTGGMVSYTIYYQDQNGNNLLDPVVNYGMVGDKPVVSYQYVSPQYQPVVRNLGKTLSADESQNVITFTYRYVAPPTPTPAATAGTTGGTTNTGTTGTTGTNPANNIANIPGTTGANNTAGNTGNNAAGNAADNNAAGNNTAGNAADNNAADNAADTNAAGTTETAETGTAPSENAGGNTGVIEEAAQNIAEATPEAENTEPIEYIDLDEEEVPLAGVDDAAKEGAEADEAEAAVTEESGSKVNPIVWVVAGVAAAAVIGAIAYNSSKRKAEGDEDEDDSDLDE